MWGGAYRRKRESSIRDFLNLGPSRKRISNRITNEVDGVKHLCYDITSKPPGTIEWE